MPHYEWGQQNQAASQALPGISHVGVAVDAWRTGDLLVLCLLLRWMSSNWFSSVKERREKHPFGKAELGWLLKGVKWGSCRVDQLYFRSSLHSKEQGEDAECWVLAQPSAWETHHPAPFSSLPWITSHFVKDLQQERLQVDWKML